MGRASENSTLGAKAKSRILTDLGISLAAALVTPAFLFLLTSDPVSVTSLLWIFLISGLYALAITFMADLTLHRIHCYVVHRSRAVQWSVLIVTLIVVSSAGCVLATGALVGL